MWGITEVLLFLVLGVILFFKCGSPRKNLPPGPRGVPIFGNVFQMGENPHLKFSEWARKYGKMYTIHLGLNTTVFLNDVKLIKEVMSDTNFSARPPMEMAELLVGGPYGIVTQSGRAWEEQRRWCLRTLRDFGLGKTSMEGLIMDEVNEMLGLIEAKGETPVVMNTVLDLAVLSALWTIMNGEKLSQSDPKIRGVLNAHHDIFPALSESGMYFAPWLKYVFPGAMRKLQVAADEIMDFSREAVTQHWDSWKEGESRDFIDEYIAEIKQTTDSTSSFFGDEGRKNLDAVVSDMIQAGSETTSYNLAWEMCYLSENPEVQRKVHQELDTVVGTSRQVSLSDKPNLPYLEATIQETLRCASLVATGVQRSALEDKEVGGFTIPKGSWVFPNIYHVHHDPAVWGDPENFRPERFLSPDGKKVTRNEALMPFQTGRRQCLGEALARDTLFLFSANVFQQYTVTKVEKEKAQISFGGNMLIPKPYHFIFKRRSL